MSDKAGLTIDQFSSNFRQRYLAVSGGWLGKFVISTSKTFGIWDPLVLFVLAVTAYSAIRTSSMIMALILGVYFDGVIPYQYYHIAGSYQVHKEHLDDYWPIFCVALLIEIGALILLDPNAFTFLVCIKSLALCWIWMGRRKGGVFLSTALRKGRFAKPSKIPIGGIDWIPVAAPSTSSAPTSSAASALTLPPMPAVPTFANADAQLCGKYPDPWVRWGMLHTLKMEKQSTAESLLKQWIEQPETTRRADKYGKIAKDAARSMPIATNTSQGAPVAITQPPPSILSHTAIAAQDPASVSEAATMSQTTESTVSLPPQPKLQKIPDADEQIKKRYQDPLTRWGMLHKLSTLKDSEAQSFLKQWTEQPYKLDREERYKQHAMTAIRTLPASDFVSDPTQHSFHTQSSILPENSPFNGIGNNFAKIDKLLSKTFPDEISREGTIESYRSCKTAGEGEALLHRWLTEKEAVKRRTAEYQEKGEIARRWRKELGNDQVPVFATPWYESWNQQLEKLYPDPWVRYGIFTETRRLPDKDRNGKLKRILEAADAKSKSNRIQVYGEIANEVADLWNDDKGRKWCVDPYVNSHSGKKAEDRYWVDDTVRQGKVLLDAQLRELDQKMVDQRVMRMEREKILEILGRERTKTQEEAAVNRLKRLKVDFDLKDIASVPKRSAKPTPIANDNQAFHSKLDPGLARWLQDKVGNDAVQVVDKRKTMAVLDTAEQTKDEMEEIGALLNQLAIAPTTATNSKDRLAFKTEQLYDFRLKLLKGYQDSYLVDVMEAEVVRQTSKEKSNELANLMITAANENKQDIMRKRYGARAQQLEHQLEDLRQRYNDSIVQVMEVDILFDPSLYSQYIQIGNNKHKGRRHRAKYDALVNDLRDRAVDEAYFKHWRKKDLKKDGVFNKIMSKIGLGTHHFE